MGLLQLKTGPFHRFGSRYSTLFDSEHFLGRNALDDSWLTHAPADIKENGKEIFVDLALPGFAKEDVKLDMANSELHISASRKVELSDATYEIEEIPKKINRYFQLTSAMDKDNISADLTNGVLRVTIPYLKKPKKAGKQVSIR